MPPTASTQSQTEKPQKKRIKKDIERETGGERVQGEEVWGGGDWKTQRCNSKEPRVNRLTSSLQRPVNYTLLFDEVTLGNNTYSN